MSKFKDDYYRQLYKSILARLQSLDEEGNIYADIEVRLKKLRLNLTLKDFKKEVMSLFLSYNFPEGFFKESPEIFIKNIIKDI